VTWTGSVVDVLSPVKIHWPFLCVTGSSAGTVVSARTASIGITWAGTDIPRRISVSARNVVARDGPKSLGAFSSFRAVARTVVVSTSTSGSLRNPAI
jgi:SH3-like domain-containing protein